MRIAVLREIAAAQARAAHREQAEATFGEAMQSSGWKDALQRADALYGIVRAEAAAGMTAAADTTYDQALRATEDVRLVGEKGRLTLPMPEWRLALLRRELAMRRVEVGDMARTLQIARSIPYDSQARALTLLALADLQMRAGSAVEATLDEALAAEHDARSGLVDWPSRRDVGIAVTKSPGNVRLPCDIAKAQVRAGLTSKGVATFDEALRAAEAITMVDPALQGEVIAGALATVADAEREVGLEAAVQATLDRATAVAEAITDNLNRAQALARLVEVRTKAVGAAQDLFVRALSIAHTLPGDCQRAQALQVVAAAQASAGQRDTSALTFAEAIRLARNLDRDCSGYITRPPPYCLGEMEMLSRFAEAQRRAGLINEAAATFDEALNAVLSGTEQWKQNHLLRLARREDTRTPRDDVVPGQADAREEPQWIGPPIVPFLSAGERRARCSARRGTFLTPAPRWGAWSSEDRAVIRTVPTATPIAARRKILWPKATRFSAWGQRCQAKLDAYRCASFGLILLRKLTFCTSPSS